jgi:hypothetical protein
MRVGEPVHGPVDGFEERVAGGDVGVGAALGSVKEMQAVRAT